MRELDIETSAACASTTSEPCAPTSDGPPDHIQPEWPIRENTHQCPDSSSGDEERTGSSKSEGKAVE